MDPDLGLSLELSGRTLITHDSDDLEDRGFAASLLFDPEPAYGMPAFSGRFTGSPHVGLDFAADTCSYRLGWRLTPAQGAPEVSFGLKATRWESDGTVPEHTLGAEISMQW